VCARASYLQSSYRLSALIPDPSQRRIRIRVMSAPRRMQSFSSACARLAAAYFPSASGHQPVVRSTARCATLQTSARRYKINRTGHRTRLLTRTKAFFPRLHRLIACHYGTLVLAPCARRLHRPLASNRKSRAAGQRQGLGMAKRATLATRITGTETRPDLALGRAPVVAGTPRLCRAQPHSPARCQRMTQTPWRQLHPPQVLMRAARLCSVRRCCPFAFPARRRSRRVRRQRRCPASARQCRAYSTESAAAGDLIRLWLLPCRTHLTPSL
jgi:hypothetical protein